MAPPPFFTGFWLRIRRPSAMIKASFCPTELICMRTAVRWNKRCSMQKPSPGLKLARINSTSMTKKAGRCCPTARVLTVDAYVPVSILYIPDGTNSEIYNPHNGKWSSAGSTIVQLWDSTAACGRFTNNTTFEVGPGVLRPDGTVFYTGANTCPCAAGNTAIYNSTNGYWTDGPQFPAPNIIADGPAALGTERQGSHVCQS